MRAKDFTFSMKTLLSEGLKDYQVIIGETASASVEIAQDFNKLRGRIGTGEGRALRTQEERDLALGAFDKIFAERERIEGVIRQANTDIETTRQQIQQRERAIAQLGPIPDEGSLRSGKGRRLFTGEEKKTLDTLKRILKNLTD